MVTRHQLRIIDAAVQISQQLPHEQEKAFLARQLVQATLPHRAPKGTPPVWARSNGDFTLSIRPGYKHDPVTGQQVCIGYPFGNIPRLLLFWITTESLRTKSRRLEMGDTLSAFLRQLNLDAESRGPRSDAVRLRNQMERLFSAAITFRNEKSDHLQMLNINIADRTELWWDPKEPNPAQPPLFGSWIQLGEQFFHAITESPVPVDIKALCALKNSPLALDLYAWASFKTFIASTTDKTQTIPWKSLQLQMGGDYARPRDFRDAVIHALHKVRTVFPGLVVEADDKALTIKPGRPAVLPNKT